MSDADTATAIEVEPAQVASQLAAGEGPRPQLVDVREPYERDAGFIDGSAHIELTRLAQGADALERGRPVIFYCRVGARSLMAAQALRAAGYEAYSMAGGLARWAREGLPLSPDGGYVADH
ncbi:MAG TPA: rhodanese-like domain-containing protein [Solirubrobacteraceae bacterium]|jgi:hydroxyacylglutathione hydrolase/adenylyltransferase/sulfurtransferase|nr:rhodanese-like domain-containing protein [Solirubrobacteraceae bacterium]